MYKQVGVGSDTKVGYTKAHTLPISDSGIENDILTLPVTLLHWVIPSPLR